jgi:hypothetical protein
MFTNYTTGPLLLLEEARTFYHICFPCQMLYAFIIQFFAPILRILLDALWPSWYYQLT